MQRRLRTFPSTSSRRLARLFLALAWAVWALANSTEHVARADDWPQWLGEKRDGLWRESGVIDAWPTNGPQVQWRTPIGAGYSGPAVAAGKLYVMDRQTPLDDGGNPVANADGSLPGTERVLCLDAATGQIAWQREHDTPYKISYPSGPRCTPTVDGPCVYTLGAMGRLMCLDAAKGDVLWQRELLTDFKCPPPVWGFAAHPLVDGDKLITLVGGDGSAVVAFDKNTGKELWRALTAQEVGYAPPMIYELDGRRQLIIWLDTELVALDPDNGGVLWRQEFPAGGNPQRPTVTIATPRTSDGRVFLSDFYSGPLMVAPGRGDAPAEAVWKAAPKDPQHRETLNALMTTPVIQDGHVYGIAGDGELRCLDAATGKLVWREIAPVGERRTLFGTCFLVPHTNGLWFLFNDQGYLIAARVTPAGYEELGRAQIVEPTLAARGRDVVWSHPAFADRAMFVRNDRELVRVDLSKPNAG